MDEIIYYSQKAGGFFSSEQHATIPDDAVEVGRDEYSALLVAQGNGKIIAPDENGRPVLADPPAPTAEQVRLIRLDHYRSESDPLKIEAEHDAIVAGTEPDYTAWLAKVAEIKERYPLPDQQ